MIAGIGFRSAATVSSLRDALARAGAPDPCRVALPETKAAHPACAELAMQGFTLIPVTAAAMQAAPTHTRSAHALAAHGTGSVAEACALAAAGPGARLKGPRSISGDGMATAALALCKEDP